MRVRLSLVTLFLLIGLVCSIVSHVWMSWRLEHLRRENQRQAVELGQLVIRDPERAYLRQIVSPSPGVMKFRVYLPPGRRYVLRRATNWFGEGFVQTEPWAEVYLPRDGGEFVLSVWLSDVRGDLHYQVRGLNRLNANDRLSGGGSLVPQTALTTHRRQRNLDPAEPIEVIRLASAFPGHRPRGNEGLMIWISPLTEDEEEAIAGQTVSEGTFIYPPARPELLFDEQEAANQVEKLGGSARLDDDGYLASVTLQNGPVVDEELSFLKGRTKIDKLSLFKTQVTDAGLDIVKELTGLRNLSLHKSNITDVGMEKLAGLTELRRLDLSGTLVSDAGLRHLQEMREMRELVAAQTSISDAGLLHLSELTNLETLYLWRTRIDGSGLEHLAQLKNLAFLDLGYTEVGDDGLGHLVGLEKLETLRLSGTRVSDAGLVHLSQHSRLRMLTLARCRIGDVGLLSLSSLHGLHTLDLSDTQVTAAGLAHLMKLPRIQTLRLNGTAVNDDALPTLLAMRSLDHLHIADTQITDQAAYALLEKHPGLQIHRLDRRQHAAVRQLWAKGASYRHDDENVTQLFLKGPNITNVDLRRLADLRKIDTLSISQMELTDLALEDVARLPRLKVLKLSGMRINDAWLKRLAILELPIEELILEDLPITDDGLRHLAALPNLTRLEISDSQISDAGLQHLANRPELDVYLTRTRVSDAGVQELRKTVRWVEAK